MNDTRLPPLLSLPKCIDLTEICSDVIWGEEGKLVEFKS